MLRLQKHSALITPRPGHTETHRALSAPVPLLRSAGGCVQLELSAAALGRFQIQTGHLCSMAQNNRHCTPQPGQGSTGKRLVGTKVTGLMCSRSCRTSKSNPVMKVSNDPYCQTQRLCWATRHHAAQIRERDQIIYHMVCLQNSLIPNWR